MEPLKYKVITSEEQYDQYCRIAYDLDFGPGEKTSEIEDEIELLVLLIKTWDRENYPPVKPVSPIKRLKLLMDDHEIKARDLAVLLGVSKSYVSEMLSYRKGLSKKVIRKLADRFKMREEAFSRPYKLKGPGKKSTRRKTATRAAKTKRKAA